jgi:hypothetical protein
MVAFLRFLSLRTPLHATVAIVKEVDQAFRRTGDDTSAVMWDDDLLEDNPIEIS